MDNAAMKLDRRHFLSGSAALGSGMFFGCSPADSKTSDTVLTAEDASFETARTAFPWSTKEVYLNNAGRHPCGLHAVNAAREYLEFILGGPGDGANFGERQFHEVKELYGRLIGAKASEIALVQSTLTGENLVALGLGLHGGKGNVVTDELHYHGGAYIYRRLQEAGLELRIIKQKDWQVSAEEYGRAIDKDTKLVSLTLVSNINGYLYDSKAISDIAHANGAYVYADVVQAAGCVPVDVRAMGIDFCSASTYKWLMGMRGLGLFYVCEELQGEVLKAMMYGDKQYTKFEYHNFPGSPAGEQPVTYTARTGAEMYEVGNVSNVAGAAQREALKYILKLGVDNILAHAKPMCDKLIAELPPLGYPCITPEGSPTPIAAFLVENPEETSAKLKDANVVAKIKWKQMRVSPTVFNNMDDVDRLLNALS
jgi:selenocysteine lyase/cysteine desulfurase